MEATLRSRRDFAALEARRLQAAKLFEQGQPQAEIVRRFGVSRPTAHRCYRGWRRGGAVALRGAGRAGRKPRLSAGDRQTGCQRIAAASPNGPSQAIATGCGSKRSRPTPRN